MARLQRSSPRSAPTVNIAPPTETVALHRHPGQALYDLASPLLDDPAMDDEPEFTPEELADRSGDLPGSHAAAEQEAYSQFGQPTRSQIEEATQHEHSHPPRVVLRRGVAQPVPAQRRNAASSRSTQPVRKPPWRVGPAGNRWLAVLDAASRLPHVIVDADAQSARLVSDSRKAWTRHGSTHGVSRSSRSAERHKGWERDELRETARWVARWSLMHDIPPYKAKVDLASGRILRAGVIRHQARCSRRQPPRPGRHYPMDKMLALAWFYRARLKG